MVMQTGQCIQIYICQLQIEQIVTKNYLIGEIICQHNKHIIILKLLLCPVYIYFIFIYCIVHEYLAELGMCQFFRITASSGKSCHVEKLSAILVSTFPPPLQNVLFWNSRTGEGAAVLGQSPPPLILIPPTLVQYLLHWMDSPAVSLLALLISHDALTLKKVYMPIAQCKKIHFCLMCTVAYIFFTPLQVYGYKHIRFNVARYCVPWVSILSSWRSRGFSAV